MGCEGKGISCTAHRLRFTSKLATAVREYVNKGTSLKSVMEGEKRGRKRKVRGETGCRPELNNGHCARSGGPSRLNSAPG